MKVRLLPLKFAEINEREAGEYDAQMKVLHELYGDVAEFLPPVTVGEAPSGEADAIVFPQMIFAAFRHNEELLAYNLPAVVANGLHFGFGICIWISKSWSLEFQR